MGLLNEIKRGENLTHPQATPRWMLVAFVVLFVLIGVVMAVLYVWGKAANAVQNVPVVGSITAPMRVYAS